MPETPILLHIGYHKTGSTLLQDSVFSNRDGGFLSPQAPRHHLVEDFVVPPPLCFDGDATRRKYGPVVDAASQAGKVAVLSHERFSGYPPAGGFDAPIIASRLHRTFPKASVLIVLREQLSSIRAMYSQYITDGGTMSFAEYTARPDPSLSRVPGFTPEFYHYHRLVARYRDLFGADKVLVLPFELLKENRVAFGHRVCAFAGVPAIDIPDSRVNPARGLVMQTVQRRVNLLFSRNQLNRHPVLTVPRASKRFARARPVFDTLVPAALERRLADTLKKRVAQHFAGRFGPSNDRLSALCGIDLAAFGYESGGTVGKSEMQPALRVEGRI